MYRDSFLGGQRRLVPDGLVDLRGRQDVSHVPHEVFEDLVLERREADFFAVDGDALFVGVELKAAGDQHVFADLHAAEFGIAPHLGFDPGHQLKGIERLRDVVVRAETEAGDLVGVLGLRREQDDGHVARLPDLQHGGEAVHVRHHDVEHETVHIMVLQEVDRLPSVCGRQDVVSLCRQIDPDGFEDGSVIVAN